MNKVVKELKKEWKLSILLLLILSLGIFLRLDNFAEEGFWNDDTSTIPTGLLFFYPHSEYPGLLTQGEPALGNYIIGKACMWSGEDFSNVTKVPKNFFVGRDLLLGQQMTDATAYCHLPMYFFGIIFLIFIVLFSLSIIGLRPTLFVASFFSFYQFLLTYSRWLHVDIIMYAFVAIGLFLLWLSYNKPKLGKRELVYTILAFIFFAFAFATKLPAALFFFFGIGMIIEKYFKESLYLLSVLLKKIEINLFKFKTEVENKNVKQLIKLIIFSSVAYLIALLLPFEYKLSNIFAVIQRYQETSASVGALGISSVFIDGLKSLFLRMNILDSILIVFGLIIFIKLLLREHKTKNEKFLLGLMFLYIIFMPFFKAFGLERVSFIFLIGFLFIMALVFSKTSYLKKGLVLKESLLIIFILFYLGISFYPIYSNSPYFFARNPLMCFGEKEICQPTSELSLTSIKEIAIYINKHKVTNESYFSEDPTVYYYVNQGQSIEHYSFREQFRAQFGRVPTIYEYLEYLKPNGNAIRYLFLSKGKSEDESFMDFKAKYEPNDKIFLGKYEIVWVYDIFNLKSR
jgi:hypothetical protein